MTQDAKRDPRFTAPLREGGVSSVSSEIGRVDPTGIRAKLMLEATSHMMTEFNWPYRETTIELRSAGDELGSFRLFGANHPDSIAKVFRRELDISILNPGAILSMAHKGVGLFTEAMPVALIAVMPHYDQLGFAVTKASGLTSLTDIRDKRFPLRLSVRGSLDTCTTRLVEKVLNVHGFGYRDIIEWGGSISYDQPMPSQPGQDGLSRVDRAANGALDAIFEEGVVVWVNRVEGAGMRCLEIDEHHLVLLEREGFRRGKLEKIRFPSLSTDINTVDFSGWPIYTRMDAPDLLIRKFCEAVDARKHRIPWTWGMVDQDPMPLEMMLSESPSTPFDVPFHPVAEEYWAGQGYLTK